MRGIINILLAVIAGVLLFGREAMTSGLQRFAVVAVATFAIHLVLIGVRAILSWIRTEWRAAGNTEERLSIAFATAAGCILVPLGAYVLWLWVAGAENPISTAAYSWLGWAWIGLLLLLMAGYGIYGLRWHSGHWSEVRASSATDCGYSCEATSSSSAALSPSRSASGASGASGFGNGRQACARCLHDCPRPCRVVQDGVAQHPCCLRSSLGSSHRRLVDHLRTVSAEQVRRISDACQRHRQLTRRPTTKTGDPASAGFFVARVASVLHGIDSNTLKSPQISGFQCNVLPHESRPCGRALPMKYLFILVFAGAPGRNRTADLRFTKPLLYQLSYKGTALRLAYLLRQ